MSVIYTLLFTTTITILLNIVVIDGIKHVYKFYELSGMEPSFIAIGLLYTLDYFLLFWISVITIISLIAITITNKYKKHLFIICITFVNLELIYLIWYFIFGFAFFIKDYGSYIQ